MKTLATANQPRKRSSMPLLLLSIALTVLAWAWSGFWTGQAPERAPERETADHSAGSRSAFEPSDDAAEAMSAVVPGPVNLGADVLRSEPALVAALEAAIAGGEVDAIEEATSAAAGCRACRAGLVRLMTDLSNPLELRVAAARALLRAGTRRGVESVLEELQRAGRQSDDETRLALLQSLTEPSSPEASELVTEALLKDGVDDPAAGEQELIAQVLHGTADVPRVSDLLAALYDAATTEEARARIEAIGHPGVEARLAIEAYQQGRREEAERWLERLGESQSSSALDAAMLLAAEPSVPADAAADLAHAWMAEGLSIEAERRDALIGYLTDPTSTREQREAASFALAAAHEREPALSALEKARTIETDPGVLAQIDASIKLLRDG